MLTNIEKYESIHAEIMNRLKTGKITVEMAKEVNDQAFSKYVVESGDDKQALRDKVAELKKQLAECEAERRKINDVNGNPEEFKKMQTLDERMKKLGQEIKDISKKLSGGQVFTPKDV